MANDYFSNEDVHVEAVFGETNNVLICSRSHLKDYSYTWKNDDLFYDDYGVCYEEAPVEYSEDSYDPSGEVSPDLKETYENLYEEDKELMRSMGLPTSFGRKQVARQNWNGYYSAYDDNYETEDSNEENEYSEDYEKNHDSKYYKSHNSDFEVNGELSEFTKSDSEWENFWNLHGYTICLNSWTQKYKDYIAPEYLKGFRDFNNDKTKAEDKIENCGISPSEDSKSVIHDNSVQHSENDENSKNCQNIHENDLEMNTWYQKLKGNASCKDFEICKKLLNKHSEKVKKMIDDQNESNCDSALNNMNDKFQGMSFSEENCTKFVNDGKVTFSAIESETSISENVKLEDLEENFESDVLSENTLLHETANLAENKKRFDYLEEFAQLLDDDHPGDVSHEAESESQNKSSTDSTENQSSLDHDHELLKENFSEYFEQKYTRNPLFTCTRSDEDYIAESSEEAGKSWEELWKEHCKEEQDKWLKLLAEDSFVLPKLIGSDAKKCKFCGEFSCGICNSDYQDHTVFSSDDTKADLFNLNAYTKYYLNCSLSEILAYPLIDSNTDDEPPVELSIKRPHEVESEDEEPEAVIKDLGLVIKPTSSLIVKRNKRRRHRKPRRFNRSCNPEEDTKDINQENDETVNHMQHETTEANASKGDDDLIPAENANMAEEVKKNSKGEEIDLEQNAEQMNADEPCQEIDLFEGDQVLHKYWHQRYRLFHRFDEGIKLDEESWFSVTPERIARHIAERCACRVMIDAFCGAGGNAIQFASVCNHVIAIDIDPHKIELAKHNATVYGVSEYVDFIVGDYLKLASHLKADGVFLSPPWGGPSYAQDAEYDLAKIEPDIYKTFEITRKITENIILFVPKNTIINQLVQLSGEGNNVEIEQNFLNKKVKTITAYYGDFVNKGGST